MDAWLKQMMDGKNLCLIPQRYIGVISSRLKAKEIKAAIKYLDRLLAKLDKESPKISLGIRKKISHTQTQSLLGQ